MTATTNTQKEGRAVRLAGQVPVWAWLSLVGLLATPWYLRYLIVVLGQGCGFLLPVR